MRQAEAKKIEITRLFLDFMKNIQDQKFIQFLMNEGAQATYRGDVVNLALVRNYMDFSRALSQKYQAQKPNGINLDFVTHIMGQAIQTLQDIQIQDFGKAIREVQQQEATTDVMRAQEAKMRGRGRTTGQSPNKKMTVEEMVMGNNYGIKRESAAKFLRDYGGNREVLNFLNVPKKWEIYNKATGEGKARYPDHSPGASREDFNSRLIQFINAYGLTAAAPYLRTLGIPLGDPSWSERARQEGWQQGSGHNI